MPTPRLLGVSGRCCFGSHTLPSRTVALLTQSYPAEREETLLQLGFATSTSRSFGGRSPRSRRTVGRRAPHVRDDSGRSPRSARSFYRIAKIECWKVQFRYFRNELFRQELDIILVGLGLQQESTTNQTAPAPGPRGKTTSRKTDGQCRNPNFDDGLPAGTITS